MLYQRAVRRYFSGIFHKKYCANSKKNGYFRTVYEIKKKPLEYTLQYLIMKFFKNLSSRTVFLILFSNQVLQRFGM